MGAGAIGLACAEQLAAGHCSVVVLERHAGAGRETSSRSSGVLHAGIYYPAGSLKADLCRRGRALLVERAERGDFELEQTGKLVLATTDSELGELSRLAENARACHVELELLERAEVLALEPLVDAVGALHSRGSGILDVDGLLRALQRGAIHRGATFAFSTTLVGLDRGESCWNLRANAADGSDVRISARWVINAAGLWADQVATLAGVDVERLGLRQFPCKGSYFTVAPRIGRQIRHLVYPLPSGPGLGIHLTLDLAGGVRAGPDSDYVEHWDYGVDETKQAAFFEAVRRYVPTLRPDDLTPAYAGIRPKLARPGDAFRDFALRHEAAIGLPGLVNLIGIESPGLTASLAIAERVRALVDEAD